VGVGVSWVYVCMGGGVGVHGLCVWGGGGGLSREEGNGGRHRWRGAQKSV
jgi:hypothetical protein